MAEKGATKKKPNAQTLDLVTRDRKVHLPTRKPKTYHLPTLRLPLNNPTSFIKLRPLLEEPGAGFRSDEGGGTRCRAATWGAPSRCMHIHIYIYMYTYFGMYICIYLNICTHRLLHTQNLTHSDSHSLTPSLTHSLTHSLTDSLTHSLTHKHTHTHTHTHTRTHSLSVYIYISM